MAVASCRFEARYRPGGDSDGSPTPTHTPGFGDGSDGNLVLADARVLDSCHSIQSASQTTIVMGTAANAFLPRGWLLLHQVRDDLVATSGDQNPLTAPGSAGQWEITRVASVGPGSPVIVTVVDPLGRTFVSDPRRRAQACRMPEFGTVQVKAGAQLSAKAWNGFRGGVLAFFASELNVEADGELTMDGKGDRAGDFGPTGNPGDVYEYDYPASDNAGGKGEGLDTQSYGLAGRGNRANAGGGGNADNNGGGGGGNGGAGGRGGWRNANNSNGPGLGGVPVQMTMEILVFGGGGGAGHWDYIANGTAGSGGGVILLIARTLVGSGTIASRGIAGGLGTNDGSGGGGAGGTLLLVTGTANSFTGTITADGGAGGGVSGIHGPGGGGGGGRVYLPSLRLGGAAVSALGGAAGLSGSDPRGAAAGGNGPIVDNGAE